MAKLTEMLSRIKLVYKRSGNLTKIVVLCAIVISTVTLLALRYSLLDTQSRIDALKDQAAGLEQEHDRLEDKNSALGSVDGIKDIAGEELDLVDPDTVIIEPGN